MAIEIDEQTTEVLIGKTEDGDLVDNVTDPGEVRFRIHVETGRDWEPEVDPETGGETIRTTPVVTIEVLEEEGGNHHIRLLAGPVVYRHFKTLHVDPAADLVMTIIRDLEVEQDGIEKVIVNFVDEDSHLSNKVRTIDSLVTEWGGTVE